MPKATDTHNTTDAPDADDRHALLDIEENLRQLSAAEKLLGHLCVSELDVEGDEIAAVQGMIGDAQAAIARSWQLAREQRQAELEARRARGVLARIRAAWRGQ